jgi:DNA-binding NarL/FixJ family response regulator
VRPAAAIRQRSLAVDWPSGGQQPGGSHISSNPCVSDLAELSMSVRKIGEGGSVLDPSVVAQLVDQRRVGDDPLEHLTERELEVLTLMAEGRSNKGIGGRLFITEHTVEKHVKNIFATLRLPQSADDHRRVLAVVTFLNSR